MIKILFWNLKQHDLSSLIMELTRTNDIDIVILAEYANLKINEIQELNEKGRLQPSLFAFGNDERNSIVT